MAAPLALDVAPEVAAALAATSPVVALESTIVAHGMPFPANLEVARELEATVRAGGATPATIAVVGGRVRIGLPDDALAALAEHGTRFAKAGAADLAVHLARGGDAATTVSATAVLAAAAGIRVFATGGIGGVHRGAGADVSHDLTVLARTPIAVISAGRQGHPRSAAHPRDPRDPGRAGDRLRHRRAAGVLHPQLRPPPRPSRRRRRRARRHLPRPLGPARPGRRAGVQPHPRRGRARCRGDRSGHRRVARRRRGRRRHRQAPHARILLARLARVTGGAAVTANRALARNNAAVGAALAVALQPPG